MKIEGRELELYYGHEKVLNGVDIQILSGSFTAIID